MKPTQMTEGTEVFTNFTNAMRAVFSVPHSVMVQRLKVHSAEVETNPSRRGPKRKPKVPPSAPA